MLAHLPLSSSSLAALLSASVIFIASWLVFYVLERIWTQRRGWIDLADWARERRFKLLGRKRARMPILLHEHLATAVPQVTMARPGYTMTRLHSSDERGALHRLNILEREIDAHWPTTALRPSQVKGSIVDLFSLGNFPTLAPADRFHVLGLDASAARRLVRSSIGGLLPPDVGLLIEGNRMLLEFSDRPFDPIELDRVVALAEQVAQRLPPLVNRV